LAATQHGQGTQFIRSGGALRHDIALPGAMLSFLLSEHEKGVVKMSWLILLSPFFASISAIAAAIAAIASVSSILQTKKDAREQRAADSIKKYTELALQYPALSTEKGKTGEQRHEWFVSFMLLMVQDILGAHGRDEIWRNFAKRQIGFFKADLEPWLDEDLEEYGNGVIALVREVVPNKKKS
jgi:hypothetical protein